MKGIVKFINQNRGLCAIELDTNNYTIFEDLDGNLSINDIVSGNLEDLGGDTIYNITQQIHVDGSIENIGCSFNQLKNQLGE